MDVSSQHNTSTTPSIMPFTTQNDADTVDPESLYDKAAEEIGNLEQKLALSNASNEMATEEIKHLKSVIQDQSQEIDGLKKERMTKIDHLQAENSDYREENLHNLIKGIHLVQDEESWAEEKAVMTEEIRRLKSVQAHLQANISDYRKKYVSLFEEKYKLEEKLRRQKCELATLNKKVEKSSKGKRGGGGVNIDLMARIERQKRELARLNKQVELRSRKPTESAIVNDLMVKIERQKRELANLNRQVELKSSEQGKGAEPRGLMSRLML